MLKAGLTGGIGSGKSLVAEMFSILGIPVLNADATARFLTDTDAALKAAITVLFGEAIYQNGRLNRPFLASLVFNDKAQLQKLNNLVHPATVAYGQQWFKQQKDVPYVLKEAAIFFESGTYVEMDLMIGVSAPLELRLKRAMERDNITETEVRRRMDNQMDEAEKMKRCDYIIHNDGSQSVIQQVLKIHEALKDKSQSQQ
jgi:dephospho-CoA kinase